MIRKLFIKMRIVQNAKNVTNYRIFKIQISDMSGEYLSSKYTNMTSTEYLAVLLSDPNEKYKLIAPEGIMTITCAMHQDPYINDTQECIDNNFRKQFQKDIPQSVLQTNG
jgi:hypothetical protein